MIANKIVNEIGSPAWAGIDPLILAALRRWWRFPRVGGDRPGHKGGVQMIRRVPPRGRG